MKVCLCVCQSVSVNVRVSVCLSVSLSAGSSVWQCLSVCFHVCSGPNCLRELGLSSIQDGTDGAFSEPCRSGPCPRLTWQLLSHKLNNINSDPPERNNTGFLSSKTTKRQIRFNTSLDLMMKYNEISSNSLQSLFKPEAN